METKNQRLTDEEFSKERKQVLTTWPTGKQVDLDEAVAYHKALPPNKNHVKHLHQVKSKGAIAFCSMMGLSPMEKDIEANWSE